MSNQIPAEILVQDKLKALRNRFPERLFYKSLVIRDTLTDAMIACINNDYSNYFEFDTTECAKILSTMHDLFPEDKFYESIILQGYITKKQCMAVKKSYDRLTTAGIIKL